MKTTDWTQYYSQKSRVNQVTRNYVQGILIRAIQQYCVQNPAILEGGGANSCFFQAIYQQIKPSRYTVLDNNTYGLELFRQQYLQLPNIDAIQVDLTAGPVSTELSVGDLVFSAGLIEHFDAPTTAKVVETHFRMAKPGGIVLMTFPTPTRKYRMTRKLMEWIRVWKFYDERPLLPEEVLQAASPFGTLLESTLMDHMPLTQQLMIFRKYEYL